MKTYHLLTLIILISLSSCGGTKETEDRDTKFCLSDTLYNNLTLDTATLLPLKGEIVLNGKISSNEDKLVKVYPLVGGHVLDLKVELGDHVTKGQILAVIRSSEAAAFENQLQTARSNLSIAEKNFEVATDMYNGGLSSEKDLVIAGKELEKARGELRRIEEVLSIYGVQENSIYTVKAPIAGFIVAKNISENMQLREDNTEQIFVISDIEEVWVIANVFESDVSKVQMGYEVNITTLAYPNTIYKGKIDKIFSVMDPESRVEKVRIKVSNHDFLLKPEMFAKVIVHHELPGEKITIAQKAVVFDKNKNFVLIYSDRCKIEIREVILSNSYGDRYYIDGGIKAGEKVITSGPLLIYNALQN